MHNACCAILLHERMYTTKQALTDTPKLTCRVAETAAGSAWSENENGAERGSRFNPCFEEVGLAHGDSMFTVLPGILVSL